MISNLKLFMVLSLSLLTACDSQEQKKTTPVLPKVVIAPVLQQTIPIAMQFAGTVRGNKEVVIKPQVSGYIVQQLFVDGSQVKTGTPLYQIDPRPFQANLNAAKAQLKRDQANSSFWNKEVIRYQQLSKKGFVSKAKMDSVAARQKEFAAAVLKDRADIEQSTLDLEYCSITAPFDGWIQQTNVYKGAVVSAQQTALTTLTSLDPIYVDFQISRRDAYTIQQLSIKGLGPQKRSDITAKITLPDNSTYPQQGHVDYSSASFNPDTDTMVVRAIFPNQSIDHAHHYGLALVLTPGQYVPIILTVGQRPNALLIPQTALQETQQGSFVYVLGKNNTVTKRMLQKGVAYQQYWVIEKGLKAGEQVISEGLQKIRKSGIQVQPVKSETKKSS